MKETIGTYGNKYHKTIFGLCGTPVVIDVYRVLDAFPTGDSGVDHAIKKMLCAGARGHKDIITDYENAIESLQKALVLLKQKQEYYRTVATGEPNESTST